MAADWHVSQGPFDIPDVPDFVPRRLKPYLFIFFVLIIQFSGGVYLAAVSDMVGTTALMREDILMAGYASLVGMAVNFAVMFRIKFRFSTRMQLIVSGLVLIAANVICAYTDNVPLLVGTCFVAGWFRMQATFACNSTIQLWLTPVRDMAVFFCYVYIIVDSVIQLSGIATVYTAFLSQWEYMHWIMVGLLALMVVLVGLLVRPVRGPMFIPLLGIDWIGAALWAVFMLCFAFVCVYGNYYDWWEAEEIIGATLIGGFGMVQAQALVVSMKEIFGWLLVVALVSLVAILTSHVSLRPFAVFPKWSSIRRSIRHMVRVRAMKVR